MDPIAFNAELSEPVQQWIALGIDQPLLTDAELLELYRYSRSSTALNEIVRRHSPLVASVIRRLISNSQDAEDAFQATFLVLVLSVKKIRNPDSLGSWLYGVAYRTAKRVRSQRRSDNIKMARQSAVGIDLDSTKSTIEEPLAIIARELQLEAMDEELSKLPKHLRDALIEHYMAGNSVPEIARCLNLSVTAVEGRLKRGRKALRMQLAMRGISLTVVAAACIRFQQDVVGASAEPWTHRFLELIGNVGVTHPTLTQLQDTSTVSNQLFKLVQGEVVVNTFSRSVLGVAGGVLVLSALGTIGFVSALANPQGSNATAAGNRTFTLASENEQTQDSDPIAIGQTGGGSSGGLGSAGNGGNPQGNQPSKETVLKWEKPTAPSPPWLDPKPETNQTEARIRRSLNERGEVNFNGTPLGGVVKTLKAQYDIPIIIDEKSLEEASITLDEPITIELPPTSFRGALSLILRPLGLTYVIDKECMIITTDQSEWGQIRYYDVSYLLPDNGLTNELISTIETMISPRAWQPNGGGYSIKSIGSMLVVKADEETHFEIERMLRALSQQTPANLKARVFVDKPSTKTLEQEKSVGKR